MQDTNTDNFKQDVSSHNKVIVDFWAPWCGPCRAVSLSLQKLAEETDAKILKVNIDENKELAVNHGVRAIPTLIVFENGEEKKRKVGSSTYSNLKEWAAE